MRRVRRRGFDRMKGRRGGNALPTVQVKELRESETSKAEMQSRRKRGSGNVFCFTRVFGITRMSGGVTRSCTTPEQGGRPTDILDVCCQIWACPDNSKGSHNLL